MEQINTENIAVINTLVYELLTHIKNAFRSAKRARTCIQCGVCFRRDAENEIVCRYHVVSTYEIKKVSNNTKYITIMACRKCYKGLGDAKYSGVKKLNSDTYINHKRAVMKLIFLNTKEYAKRIITREYSEDCTIKNITIDKMTSFCIIRQYCPICGSPDENSKEMCSYHIPSVRNLVHLLMMIPVKVWLVAHSAPYDVIRIIMSECLRVL